MADSTLIMKNTMFMAVRMLFSMGVSLFTSRVVLQQLGVTDFGIYSVVAGLALMMSFFTSALSTAMQRFMSVELATGRFGGMRQVFAASCGCIVVLAAAFLILAETGGIWFMNTTLSIPAGRLPDAHIVYQLALVIALIEMMRVPYDSLIISHERMSFYAYNSIFEVCLKLTMALMLALTPGTKLLVYMALLIAVALAVNCSYIWYCRRTFPTLRFSLRTSRANMLEIGKFAGWNVITSISDIGYQQGSAMILNVFYGVTLNATLGIANQVKFAVTAFTRSVQSAANPQLIRIFAAGERADFSLLFQRISRVSFFLVAAIGMPIIINAPYILQLWLSVVPPNGVAFVRLMVVFCMVDSLTGPLWVSMQATGRIAVYQIVISVTWLMCLPLIYLVFSLGLPSYWMMLVLIGINISLLTVRVLFTHHYCGVSLDSYLFGVLGRILLVAAGSCLPTSWTLILGLSPLVLLFTSTAVWCAALALMVYAAGLTATERAAVRSRISRWCHSFH